MPNCRLVRLSERSKQSKKSLGGTGRGLERTSPTWISLPLKSGKFILDPALGKQQDYTGHNMKPEADIVNENSLL